MKYCEVIKNSSLKDEMEMWSSIQRISNFLEDLSKTHPKEVHKFIKDEYIALNGKHLTEQVAKQLVNGMYHTDSKKEVISGELITFDEAQELISDKPNTEHCKWDAYAAANAMAHDIANVNLNKNQILNVAKSFFFKDEDFSDSSKVFWYFEWMLF